MLTLVVGLIVLWYEVFCLSEHSLIAKKELILFSLCISWACVSFRLATCLNLVFPFVGSTWIVGRLPVNVLRVVLTQQLRYYSIHEIIFKKDNIEKKMCQTTGGLRQVWAYLPFEQKLNTKMYSYFSNTSYFWKAYFLILRNCM